MEVRSPLHFATSKVVNAGGGVARVEQQELDFGVQAPLGVMFNWVAISANTHGIGTTQGLHLSAGLVMEDDEVPLGQIFEFDRGTGTGGVAAVSDLTSDVIAMAGIDTYEQDGTPGTAELGWFKNPLAIFDFTFVGPEGRPYTTRPVRHVHQITLDTGISIQAAFSTLHICYQFIELNDAELVRFAASRA